jgi:hypothetical protein
MTTKREAIELANAGRGCLGRAALDEPVFILRAQDKFAPDLVENWANFVERARGTATEKTRKARALAHQMRAWQELNLVKVHVLSTRSWDQLTKPLVL